MGSTGPRENKYINTNYTPPNRKPNFRSPSLGGNSNKSYNSMGRGSQGQSPTGSGVVSMVNQNRIRRTGGAAGGMLHRSPSLVSDNSAKKSIKSSGYGKAPDTHKYNRVYTPNGGTRNNQDKFGSNGSQNRVRREGAVMGSMVANNPNLKVQTSKISFSRVSSGRKVDKPSLSNRSKSDKSDRSDNSAKYRDSHTNMMSVAKSNKFVMNTRTINRDPEYRKHREELQEGIQSNNVQIDDKISKL